MSDSRDFRRWQSLTVLLMLVGYSGYYLCRSSFSTTLPLIVDELVGRGMDPSLAKVHLGTVASLGVLAYAIGKFIAGASADFFSGRRSFLLGMAGAVAFSLLFASGQTLPLFTVAWIGNRLVQSAGWVGMVKITSRWFAFSAYGRAMGVISLSYLFGDAAARLFMGWLIGLGFGWREVFYIGALVLFAILIVTAILLRESPLERGFEEPDAHRDNVFGAAGSSSVPASLGALLVPLFRTPSFVLVCLLSLGLTLVRETFNTWTPTYLVEAVGLSSAAAAKSSALFPLFGGIAVLIAGYANDRLGRIGRAWIILLGMATSTAVLALLGSLESGLHPLWSVALIVALGCLLMGPYSYLAGALALDFGAKQGSATACGIIDGVGYLGGVLAGDTIARVSESYGWTGAFTMLAFIAGTSTVVAGFLLLQQRKA